MRVTLHSDGGSRGNPGPAACAVIVRDAATEKPLHEAGYFLGLTTNNVAEYQGLLHGLNVIQKMGVTEVKIFSDSELMVRQITGEYKVKSEDLRPLHDDAQSMLLRIDIWAIRHVLRHLNKRADELANLAMDARKDVFVIDGLKNPPLAASGKSHKSAGQSKTEDGPASFVIPQLPAKGKKETKPPAKSGGKGGKKSAKAEASHTPLLPEMEADEFSSLSSAAEARVELRLPDSDENPVTDAAPIPGRNAEPSLHAPQFSKPKSPFVSSTDPASQPPKWIARLGEQPDGTICPSNNRKGQMFSFGPHTPAGLCIFAADAVLADGPLCWNADHDDAGEVICSRCKIAIEIQRTPTDDR